MAKNELSKPKIMTAREFKEQGYLMEVNRQWFHPLGLALAVTFCRHDGSDGKSKPHAPEKCRIPNGRFGPIFDYRDDPEGVMFAEPFTDDDRVLSDRVQDEFESKAAARVKLGCDEFGIQPI